MKNAIRLLNRFWPELGILFIELALFLTNYKKGAFLIGWDNLMPELNIALSLKRSIFGVWQDYRGLGLPDGMAHAANLFHAIYIWFLSILLPQNLLRYTFITGCHFAGGLGLFFLANYLFKNKKLAFVGALFYMFNLGVIQMFYAPFEVFVVHFAALPWLALFTTKALDKPSKKNLFALFIAALIFSPQGFVPTVFAAFMVLFSFLVFSNLARNRNWKTAFFVCLMVFSANAFWILPYSYNVFGNTSIIQNTRINEFSSEEIFYRNKSRGSLIDVLTLKGFMIDTIEYDSKTNTRFYFLDQWRNISRNPVFSIFSYFLAAAAGIGVFMSFKKKDKALSPYLFTIGVSFFLLANNTFILGGINDLLRNFFPIFAEAFRFPFTKFIILFAFCYTLFLIRGLEYLSSKFKKFEFVFISSAALAVLLLALPAFKGYFYSPLLRLSLPTEYQQLFSELNIKGDNGRIAVLPAESFWNWQYWKWGDIGSGFIWFGIEQPMMLRQFDPWSLYNEQFYNEFSHSITLKDTKLFENVLRKYDISYLLIDKTMQNSTTGSSINYSNLQNFALTSNLVTKDKEFGNLVLYKIKNSAEPVYSLGSNAVAKVAGAFNFTDTDQIYSQIGNYAQEDRHPDVFYLLPSLYSGKLQKDLEFVAVEDENSITFSPKKMTPISIAPNSVLEFPSLSSSEFIIPVSINVGNSQIQFLPQYPKIFINGEEILIKNEPVTIKPAVVKNPKTIEFIDTKDTVNLYQNKQAYLLNNYPNTLKLKDEKNEEIIYLDTNNWTKYSYLIPLTQARIESIKIVVSKIKSSLSSDNLLQEKNYKIIPQKDLLNLFPNDISVKDTKENGTISLSAKGNSTNELSVYLDNLYHQASFILFINEQYKSGLPMTFYIDNSFENRPELETKLSKDNKENVIVFPPTENFFDGYGFHFQVKSVGTEQAQTTLEKVSLYPIPQQTLQNIRIVSNTQAVSGNGSNKTAVESTKILPYLYTSSLPNNSYLVLSQAFDNGWKAYKVKDINLLTEILPFIFGTEIKNHVKINGWENGWMTDNNFSDDKVVLVYLPQYLEYFGFILLILVPVGFALKRNL